MKPMQYAPSAAKWLRQKLYTRPALRRKRDLDRQIRMQYDAASGDSWCEGLDMAGWGKLGGVQLCAAGAAGVYHACHRDFVRA
jgi:hypothetical protein